MKPQPSTITSHDTTEGEEIGFTISAKNSGWVMQTLADLYSNRELAVIREYSTNAYDSNKELAIANGTEIAPIHVTLPSTMHPYFSVQDFGIGMSEETLRNVYTSFGESTKRDSDDFNGMLGFGSKSAIAYTNTFTVTAIKAGIKTVAMVVRKPDYSIVLKIVMKNVKTHEPDGVTIEVPVSNINIFNSIANDFYKYWLPGSVIVNQQQPTWAAGEQIGTNLYYSKNDRSYVVMGNVAYVIENAGVLFPSGMNEMSFVAYIPLGSVEFTPNREALKYSDFTKNTLKRVIADFSKEIVTKAKSDLDKCTTHAEAYKTWSKWRDILGYRFIPDLMFKGEKLVENFNIKALRYNSASGRTGAYTVNNWPIAYTEQTLVVSDYIHLDGVSSAHKKKVRDWIGIKDEFKGKTNYILFMTDSEVKSPWFDPTRVVSWEQVKKEAPKPIRVPRAANPGAGRLAGSFDLESATGYESQKDVPTTGTLYYIMVQEHKRHSNFASLLKHFNITEKVVIVPANRQAKFLRNYPHAKPITPHLETLVNFDGPSLLSADAVLYLRLDQSEKYRLAYMDATRVDDLALVEAIRVAKLDEATLLKDYSKQYQLARAIGMANKFKEHNYGYGKNYVKIAILDSQYPLARNVSWTGQGKDGNKNREHGYLYINSCYKARKEGNTNV